MSLLVCILIVCFLVVVTFIQLERKHRVIKNQVTGTELDFLYAYRGILQKVVKIEDDLKAIDTNIKNSSGKNKSYFNAIEILQIKQNMHDNLKKVVEGFQNGKISSAMANTELNKLSKRLHLLSDKMAA